MAHLWNMKPKTIIFTPLLLALAFAVACGAAATATPVAKPAAPAAPKAPAAPTPVGAAPAAPAVPTVPAAKPAPTAAPAAVAVHPGKFTIIMGDLASERFDATFQGRAEGANNYLRILQGFLISQNEKKEMVPGIATQWGLSADGLTWTFTIRKGVKFHDGSEVTSQDVLWTLDHLMGPQAHQYSTHSSAIRISRYMDRMELRGPDQVSFTTKQPDPALGSQVSEAGVSSFGIMPKRAKVHDTEVAVAYDYNPISAGPMRLEKHVKASVMKFGRFDDFYYQPKNGFPEDRRVSFKSLDMVLVPEEATRVAAVRAGDADLVPTSLATKKQVEAGGGRMVFGQEGLFLDVRLMGCFRPQFPCHDKRVRQALDYAIDKTVFRDQLYGGPEVFQVKGWNVVTPSTIGYTPELDPRPFDPNKARQLLADAGYPGGKGFGKLTLIAHPPSAMPFVIEATQLGGEFWRRELGLDVEVKQIDGVKLKQMEAAYELDGAIWWRENDTRNDATVGGVLGNKYLDPKHYSRSHEDPELFRLALETFQILDPDKRADALRKFLPRLREESYQLSIGYANIPWAVGPRVLTWRPYPLSLYPSALHTITLK